MAGSAVMGGGVASVAGGLYEFLAGQGNGAVLLRLAFDEDGAVITDGEFLRRSGLIAGRRFGFCHGVGSGGELQGRGCGMHPPHFARKRGMLRLSGHGRGNQLP